MDRYSMDLPGGPTVLTNTTGLMMQIAHKPTSDLHIGSDSSKLGIGSGITLACSLVAESRYVLARFARVIAVLRGTTSVGVSRAAGTTRATRTAAAAVIWLWLDVVHGVYDCVDDMTAGGEVSTRVKIVVS